MLIGSGLFVSIGRARFCGQNTKCGPSKSNLTVAVELGIFYASHELICFWKWSLLISPGFARQTISSGTVKRLSLPNLCVRFAEDANRKSVSGEKMYRGVRKETRAQENEVLLKSAPFDCMKYCFFPPPVVVFAHTLESFSRCLGYREGALKRGLYLLRIIILVVEFFSVI